MSIQETITNAALRIVLREEAPSEVQELQAEVAALKTRVAAWEEIAKQLCTAVDKAKLSPYPVSGILPGQPGYRMLTWEEFGEERNNMCDHLISNVIGPAQQQAWLALRQIRIAEAETKVVCKAAIYNPVMKCHDILDEGEDMDLPITCLGCGSNMGIREIDIRAFHFMTATGIWTDINPGGRIVCHVCEYDRCAQAGWAIDDGEVLDARTNETRCVLCNFNNRHEFCSACQSPE